MLYKVHLTILLSVDLSFVKYTWTHEVKHWTHQRHCPVALHRWSRTAWAAAASSYWQPMSWAARAAAACEPLGTPGSSGWRWARPAPRKGGRPASSIYLLGNTGKVYLFGLSLGIIHAPSCWRPPTLRLPRVSSRYEYWEPHNLLEKEKKRFAVTTAKKPSQGVDTTLRLF